MLNLKNNFLKNIFIGILCVLFVSCQNKEQRVETISNEISYFKDYKTGLCFARVVSKAYHGYYIVSITTVPCETVKNVLKNVN